MTRRIALACAVVAFAASALAQAPLAINGVNDRSTYTDVATFSVPSTAGYSQVVWLDGKVVSSDTSIQVNMADYHEVFVSRTNTSTADVSNRTVRFIVAASERIDGGSTPEKGLIVWTPYPPIPSTTAEAAGAQLQLVLPKKYPLGLHLPVAATVLEANEKVRRINGWVSAPGFESSAFRLLRGHGSGFLPPQANAGVLAYSAQAAGLATTKDIEIEPSTTWTTVSGILAGNVVWTNDSRIQITGNLTIPAVGSLTIGAGTVVRINAGVNITNSGLMTINGTLDEPVVFTPAAKPAPEVHTGAWGGFFMRGSTARLVANGAIMTGSGAASSISFSPGASHRSEQPLFLLHSGASAKLTNCFLFNHAGQIGNGYNSDLTLDRCLVQRAITAGEYVGGTIIVNRSAIIEFPSVDGIYNPDIANADYDAIYFTTGTHILRDSLFGFCKDDAIDSGSGGAGTVLVTNCWVESALHEALAWSGEGRQTWTYDTVLINSGQGLEAGWTQGSTVGSPNVFADRLLTTANSVGIRFGDNYDWSYLGFLRVTNSFSLHNYRDVFAKTWNTSGSSWDTNRWVDRLEQMDLQGNRFTSFETNFPNNLSWDAQAEASKLTPFMATPVAAPVGVGFAMWTNVAAASSLTNGVPVRLSSFTTHEVQVVYTLENAAGTVANGTLTFEPGETLKKITTATVPASQGALRLTLRSAAGGEITGASDLYLVPQSAPVTLVANNHVWRYHSQGVDLGTAWRAVGFDDTAWPSGPAQLGVGDNDEATVIPGLNGTGDAFITTYFRSKFTVADVSAIGSISMSLLRDDAGVVYINGTEVYRSPNLPPAPATISFSTFGNYNRTSAPGDNTVDTATLPATALVNGTNEVAVEIHQYNAGSSDISFQLTLRGNPASAAPPQHIWFEPASNGQFRLSWVEGQYVLEEADAVTGPWRAVTGPSPVSISTTNQQKFYRLR